MQSKEQVKIWGINTWQTNKKQMANLLVPKADQCYKLQGTEYTHTALNTKSLWLLVLNGTVLQQTTAISKSAY